MIELCCEYLSAPYAFQIESTLYSCLNVKELFALNKHDICGLSDSNGIRTHNHLVRKTNTQPFSQTGQNPKSCCCHLRHILN